MNWKVLLTVCVLGLIGCREIEVHDGVLPAELIPAAQEFLGTYSGNFEHQNLLMDLSLQDQKLVVQFRDPVTGQPKEIFPQGCQSRVGDLQFIWLNRDKQPTGWSVAFDSGRCYAEGTMLSFAVQKKNNQPIQLNLNLLVSQRDQWICVPSGDPRTGYQDCHREIYRIYYEGKMTKINN